MGHSDAFQKCLLADHCLIQYLSTWAVLSAWAVLEYSGTLSAQ